MNTLEPDVDNLDDIRDDLENNNQKGKKNVLNIKRKGGGACCPTCDCCPTCGNCCPTCGDCCPTINCPTCSNCCPSCSFGSCCPSCSLGNCALAFAMSLAMAAALGGLGLGGLALGKSSKGNSGKQQELSNYRLMSDLSYDSDRLVLASELQQTREDDKQQSDEQLKEHLSNYRLMSDLSYNDDQLALLSHIKAMKDEVADMLVDNESRALIDDKVKESISDAFNTSGVATADDIKTLNSTLSHYRLMSDLSFEDDRLALMKDLQEKGANYRKLDDLSYMNDTIALQSQLVKMEEICEIVEEINNIKHFLANNVVY